MFRSLCRLHCATTVGFTTSCSSLAVSSKKKQHIFLGSPQVSALVLDDLLNSSAASDSRFQVAAIVTQPPARRERGKKVLPSPLAQYALDTGFSADLIFTPERAGEVTCNYNAEKMDKNGHIPITRRIYITSSRQLHERKS